MVLNYSSDVYSGSYSGNFSTPGNIQANAYDSGVYSEVTSETMLSLEYNLLNYTGNQNGDQVLYSNRNRVMESDAWRL